MPDPDTSAQPGKVKLFFRGCRTVIGAVSWVIPFVIMGGAYYLFPALRVNITFDGNVPHEVAWGLLASLASVGVWLGYEMWFAVSRKTSVGQLQADGLISIFFAIVLTGIGVCWATLGTLPYWFVLPWIGTLIDALGSGFLAINNAAQKPIIQQDR
jgi:hypothetical protein